MDFEEWYKDKTNNDGHDDFWTKAGLESAWDAAKDQVISQREIYQHGHKAGYSKAIDEAVKVANRYPVITEAEQTDGCAWDRDITETIANEIKELK